MLRKRSRQVTSKQAIVSDQQTKTQWNSLENQTKPTSFFSTSPRFFKGFFNSNNKINPMLSPTSILDTNPFSIVSNLFVFDNKTTKNTPQDQQQDQNHQHAWEQPNNKQGITLALVDSTNASNGSNTNDTKQQRRKLVVFGSQLRIQIPPTITHNSHESQSPREFGIKTPRKNLWPFGRNCNSSQVDHEESLSEIDEDSEEYTCVITHGPNPKTTHIFGNCIVENCCGKITPSSFASKINNNHNNNNNKGYFSSIGISIPSQQVNFLSFCHHCKKELGHGRDIFMYRGEKAFCSEECRCQEMLFDGVEN